MAMKVRYNVVDGEIVSENRGGVKSFYVPDALGSTFAIEDSLGTVTNQISYWPYGSTGSRTGSSQTPFLFAGAVGYYCDSDDRLYIRARYLGSVIGKWYTPDPIAFEGGDWNLYAYLASNPVASVDSSGLSPKQSLPRYPGPYPGPGGTKYVQCTGSRRISCIKGCVNQGGVMWCTDTLDSSGNVIGHGCQCRDGHPPFVGPPSPPKPVDCNSQELTRCGLECIALGYTLCGECKALGGKLDYYCTMKRILPRPPYV